MTKYAKGDRAWGECARSGRRMLLKDMVADGYYPDLLVDPAWRDERHPQEHLRPLHDAETLYRPAPQDLPLPTTPVLSNSLINSPTRSNVLTWTAAVAPATQIRSYEVWRSANKLPTAAGFAASFTRITTVTVVRDAFTLITNNPLTYTDPFASINLELGNFYHYYVLAIPEQGPIAKSNTLPVAIPPNAVVLSAVYNASLLRIELSWTASSSISTSIASYRVERSVDGGAYTTLATTSNLTLVYNDAAIDRVLHSYTYRVFALDVLGIVSDASNTKFFAKLLTAATFVIDQVIQHRDATIDFVYPKPQPSGVDLVIRATTANSVNVSCLPILGMYPKPATGKFYWEARCSSIGTRFNSGFDQNWGFTSDAQAVQASTDQITANGADTLVVLDGFEGGNSMAIISNLVALFTNAAGQVLVNTIVHVAVDFALNKVWFGLNGVWQGAGTQNPATGQGGYWMADETSVQIAGALPRRWYAPWHCVTSSGATPEESQYRFSQVNWTLTPPAGFSEWIPFQPFVSSSTTPNFSDPDALLNIKQFCPGLAMAVNDSGATPRQLRSGNTHGGAASGKRYFEITSLSDSVTNGATLQAFQSGIVRTTDASAVDVGTSGIGSDAFGTIRSHAITLAPYGGTAYMNTVDPRAASAMLGGDTMMVAINFAIDRIYFGMNGVWYAGQDPTNPAHGAPLPNLGVTNWRAAWSSNSTPFKALFNTGGIPFFHTMPTGYLGWDQEV
jgi:hypothetical protein